VTAYTADIAEKGRRGTERLMEDESGGLFNIEVDSSGETATKSEKVPRDFQSEEDFQRQRQEWKPKSETGELWKSLALPIENPSKPQAQSILHAIEELYFFRRYEEARKVAGECLESRSLIPDLRQALMDYKKRCEDKLSNIGNGKPSA